MPWAEGEQGGMTGCPLGCSSSGRRAFFSASPVCSSACFTRSSTGSRAGMASSRRGRTSLRGSIDTRPFSQADLWYRWRDREAPRSVQEIARRRNRARSSSPAMISRPWMRSPASRTRGNSRRTGSSRGRTPIGVPTPLTLGKWRSCWAELHNRGLWACGP